MEVEGMRRSEAVISFGPEDLKGVNLPHNDALMDLQGYHLEAVETALFGFAGHVVYPEGEVVLPLTLGSQDLKKTVMTTFTVVDSPSSYNIILGRPAMNELKAVASTYHQRIKFPVGVDGNLSLDIGAPTKYSPGISPDKAEKETLWP
ncbi:uncharacterized protein [Primulina huaijiensis]|uniref:uncharacterized protein n=1 Tax=Primulina huaijiensis TaxID=1492673 RepID=UPI003CC72E9E